jgi:hypothetical protein
MTIEDARMSFWYWSRVSFCEMRGFRFHVGAFGLLNCDTLNDTVTFSPDHVRESQILMLNDLKVYTTSGDARPWYSSATLQHPGPTTFPNMYP